jgi:cytochrome c biogenesis protein CcmG, thiol:disulfide interchange protein DsbE
MKFLVYRKQMLLSFIILLIGAAWIGITAMYFPEGTNGFIPAPKEGFLAPDFSLEGADGKTYQLSDFRGQAVLVNVWATWCPPCRAEMPAMQSVYEKYKNQGFTILAINATHQDNRSAVDRFTTEHQLTFPILYDIDGSATRAYQVHSFPSSFFINPNGVISEVVIGGPMAAALIQTRVETSLQGER